MNKGLLAHIISCFIYLVCIFFIYNGENIKREERIGIVVAFFIFQLYSALFIRMADWYEENTKE